MRTSRTAVLASLLAVCVFLCAGASERAELTPITVKPGDTLWSISQKYLKDSKQWDKILLHNKLPTSDPTVALPGMTLNVPTGILKTEFQAAQLERALRKVMRRRKDTADWRGVKKGSLLYEGDGLRTLEGSAARVRFHSGAKLDVGPNSLIILKSPKSGQDLMLNRGIVQGNRARLITPSARVIPTRTDTKYTARVLTDMTTRVKVYEGAADVQDLKQLRTVSVKAGQTTDVPLAGLPRSPVRMPDAELALREDMAELLASQADSAVSRPVRRPALPAGDPLGSSIRKLSLGKPVAAYHVQVAPDCLFGEIILDKEFDANEGVDLSAAGLPQGRYCARVEVIDLLGEKSGFSSPKPYVIGR